ncbi:SH3 domain-containing protein [Lysobacter enzymogenes]|uniref:SH3 domain-containing protein n=1 Tax=Lysobacter enzymogenes TaxID=69 RepID=UPI003850D128
MPRTAAIVFAATALLLALPAPAQPAAVAAPPAGETACSFGAFVNETDPAGLNVRAGPGTAHKVLGTLPPIRRSGDEPPISAMVEVEVIAGADGWFKIRGAQDNDALVEGAQRPMFKGTGWVSGRKLAVKSQAQVGRQRPDAKAPAVVSGRDGMGFDSDAFVGSARLAGCSGRWALVEYGPVERDVGAAVEIKPAAKAGLAGGRFRAWVDRLCAIQETSCDGV